MNLRNYLALGLVATIAGCMTRDYEPLVVKEKLKELESKIDQLEKKVELIHQGSTGSPEAAGRAAAQVSPQAELTPTIQPSSSAPLPLSKPLDPQLVVSSIEKKGAFVVRNATGEAIEVDLTDANLSEQEFEDLAGLMHLEKLILNGAKTPPSIFDALIQLKKLKHLEFERSAPTKDQLGKLKSLPNLTFLQLFRADLSDEAVEVISTFPALQQLRCGQTRIGDSALSHLRNLKTLRALDLSDCNRVSDTGLAYLAESPELSFLKVWGPQITDSGMDSIGRMTKLKVLGLNDTAVTDGGIQKLAGLKQLTEIHLFRTSVSDQGIEILSQLPEMLQMNLRDTKISDLAIASLATLPKLEKLDLSETNSPGFTDAAAPYFAKMKNLKQLNLWTTRTSDTVLSAIVGLQQLSWLNLDNTAITDDGVKLLRQMPQLNWLHVGSTQITDRELSTFYELKKLKYLNVSHTKISEDGFYDLDDALSAQKCQLIGP